jgi:GntR family transcriptional regulator
MSSIQWDANVPIYRQIRSQVENRLLEGSLSVGDALPSVRQMAAELAVNPLTVMRAYQQLVDEGLIEKRRGIGMHVAPGAPDKLLAAARLSFLKEEWPKILERMDRLGLDRSMLPGLN